jgi:hypothetical protein
MDKKQSILLPPEWDTFIPPQMIIHKTVFVDQNRKSSKPELNPEWLTGLEKFIRAIVSDEIAKGIVRDI